MKSVICVLLAVVPALGAAQKAATDSLESGEAGYKIGCSAASAMDIPSCGELASGKKFLPKDTKKDPLRKPKKMKIKEEPDAAPTFGGSSGGSTQR